MKEGYNPRKYQNKFRELREYYQKAVAESRMAETTFFKEVFLGVDAPLYEASANPIMLLDVSHRMNENWIGDPRWNSARRDLPASAASASTSTSGEATATEA